VARYLRTLRLAAAWAADHPREAQAIVGADVGTTPEWVVAANGAVHTELEPTLDEDGVALLARQKNFLLAHGFIDRDFDVADWIDPTPLRHALEMHS
jgi:ABC-type nitrate/sulfonate/bicarbonate transport system substrate-binding protein